MSESGAIGVTDYELAALICGNDTASGRRVAEAVGIAELIDDPTAQRAGLTSLLVRDLAGLDEGLIVAEGAATAIGTIVSTADDILRLVLRHDDTPVGRTILVDAAQGCFLLDMTAYGVHAAQPLRLDTDLFALVRDIIANVASDHADELPFDVTVSRFPVGGEVREAFLVVTGDIEPDVWSGVQAALGKSDAEAGSLARRGL